jgi:DNA-binding NarL/FixJ family response regulator
MPTKRTILWLDDEPHFLAEYANVISSDPRFQLVRESSVDAAMAQIERTDFAPDLLLWDMILPPGQFDLVRTHRGLRTGEVFLEEFRKRFPDVPAILFTNVSKEEVLQRHGSPRGRSRALRKRDLLPEELLAEIEDILQAAEGEKQPDRAR